MAACTRGSVRKQDTQGCKYTLLQGPLTIDVSISANQLSAGTIIARVSQQPPELLRYLLDENYMLTYCRYSLADNMIHLQYDAEISIAGLRALRDAIREITVKGELQYDSLRRRFPFFLEEDTLACIASGGRESSIKSRWLTQWVTQAIDVTRDMDPGRHREGISTVLTTMLFRILYLLQPEGRLLSDIRDILTNFLAEDWKPIEQKNDALLQGVTALSLLPLHTMQHFGGLPRTFSISPPLAENALKACCRYVMEHIPAYKNDQFAHIENQLWEYPLAFCGYHAHIPQQLAGLVDLMYRSNYPDYFRETGRETATSALSGATLTAFNSTLVRKIANWRFPAEHPVIAWTNSM